MRNFLVLFVATVCCFPSQGSPRIFGSDILVTCKGMLAKRRLSDAIWRSDYPSAISACKEYATYSPQIASSWVPMLAHEMGVSQTAPILNRSTDLDLARAGNALALLRSNFSWVEYPELALTEDVLIYGMRYLPLREELAKQGFTLVEPLPSQLLPLFALGGISKNDPTDYTDYLKASPDSKSRMLSKKWAALQYYAGELSTPPANPH